MSAAVEAVRSARRLLESAEAKMTSEASDFEGKEGKIDRLEEQVTSLRDANALMRAQLGNPSSEELGGPVAKALRAAAVFIFTERGAKTPRNAVLWLKSCGWGETGYNSFTDPQTRDNFLLANAVDIQARRDLKSFETLINTQ